MGKTGIASSNNVPLSIIPEGGKLGKDCSHSSIEKSFNILDDNPSWVSLTDKAKVLEPKAGLLAEERSLKAAFAAIGG